MKSECESRTLRDLEKRTQLKFATFSFNFKTPHPDDKFGKFATYVVASKDGDLPSKVKTSSGVIYNHTRGHTVKESQDNMADLLCQPGTKVVWGDIVEWSSDSLNSEKQPIYSCNTQCESTTRTQTKKMKVNNAMEINYTGQLRDARMLMIEYFGLDALDVASMTDEEVKNKIGNEFLALQTQDNDELLYLIPHDKIDKMCNDGTFRILSR